jgi:hypothetical protein
VKNISEEFLHFVVHFFVVARFPKIAGEKKKDSPEPPETVLELSRLEEQVNVVKIDITCCRIVAGT